MLAELAAANAAFGVIKSFISNGKELSGCAKQISDFVFAKEGLEKKAKQKNKIYYCTTRRDNRRDKQLRI